jgi:hypothetical protein
MLEEVGLNQEQISEVFNFIILSGEKTSEELFEYFSANRNELLQEGLKELKYVYNNLLAL